MGDTRERKVYKSYYDIHFLSSQLYRQSITYLKLDSGVSSSPLSAAYMRQWIGSALVQIMACCLFGAKPLSKPICWVIVNWTPGDKLQCNFDKKIQNFAFTKMHLKMSSAKWWPFCPGGDELVVWLGWLFHSNVSHGSMLVMNHWLFVHRWWWILAIFLDACGAFY